MDEKRHSLDIKVRHEAECLRLAEVLQGLVE